MSYGCGDQHSYLSRGNDGRNVQRSVYRLGSALNAESRALCSQHKVRKRVPFRVDTKSRVRVRYSQGCLRMQLGN